LIRTGADGNVSEPIVAAEASSFVSTGRHGYELAADEDLGRSELRDADVRP